MRVLFIVPGLGLGGTESFLLRLAKRAQATHDIEVISLGTDTALLTDFQSAGISVSVIPISSPLRIPGKLLALRKAVKDARPDVVQTFLYKADILGGSVARSVGISNVCWSLRHAVLKDGPHRLSRWATVRLGALLSRVIPQRIIAVSSECARSHIEVGYRRAKVSVIPNMLELWALQSASTLRGRPYPRGNPRLGVAARFAHEKGHDILLEAVANFIPDRLEPSLDFCGAGTGPGGPLEEFVRQRFPQLLPRCNFRGALRGSDYQAWFHDVDVFVMCSRTEGFPNALAEAAVLGLPCVATNVGAAQEIINAAQDSIVCEVDPDLLADALMGLVSRLQEPSTQPQHAHVNAWSSFYPETVMRLYEDQWMRKYSKI